MNRHRRILLLNKGAIFAADIAAPAGPYSTGVQYVFTASANGTGLSYTWAVTNATIISGQATNTLTVTFNAAGSASVSVDITDDQSRTTTAYWSSTVTGASYTPSLDFSDARNSQYLGVLN